MNYNATEKQTQQNEFQTKNGNGSERDLADVAREGAKIVVDKAQKEVECLKEDSEKYLKEACCYIKENPGKSVLAAVAGGLILGLLLKS